ncbi:hypothetical protein WJX79_007312 [Trebouxia sp. C0005]
MLVICLSGFGASGISVGVGTLCVFVGVAVATSNRVEGRQTRKHGCGSVLRELATTSQQATQASALAAHYGSWSPLLRSQTAAKKQKTSNWILRTFLLQRNTATVLSKP